MEKKDKYYDSSTAFPLKVGETRVWDVESKPQPLRHPNVTGYQADHGAFQVTFERDSSGNIIMSIPYMGEFQVDDAFWKRISPNGFPKVDANMGLLTRILTSYMLERMGMLEDNENTYSDVSTSLATDIATRLFLNSDRTVVSNVADIIHTGIDEAIRKERKRLHIMHYPDRGTFVDGPEVIGFDRSGNMEFIYGCDSGAGMEFFTRNGGAFSPVAFQYISEEVHNEEDIPF